MFVQQQVMIPFQKIFTLIVRTFSKPALSYLKQRQQQNKMVYLRWVFVHIGRRYQIFEHWLNHKILKTTHKKQMNQLKDQILLQKGIEASYELFFYCIVIGLPMYQLYTSAVSTQKKEKKLNQNIGHMQRQLKQLNNHLTNSIEVVKDRQSQRQKLIGQRQNLIVSARKQRQERRNKQYRQFLIRKQQEQHQRLAQLMLQQQKQNTLTNLQSSIQQHNRQQRSQLLPTNNQATQRGPI